MKKTELWLGSRQGAKFPILMSKGRGQWPKSRMRQLGQSGTNCMSSHMTPYIFARGLRSAGEVLFWGGFLTHSKYHRNISGPGKS